MVFMFLLFFLTWQTQHIKNIQLQNFCIYNYYWCNFRKPESLPCNCKWSQYVDKDHEQITTDDLCIKEELKVQLERKDVS